MMRKANQRTKTSPKFPKMIPRLNLRRRSHSPYPFGPQRSAWWFTVEASAHLGNQEPITHSQFCFKFVSYRPRKLIHIAIGIAVGRPNTLFPFDSLTHMPCVWRCVLPKERVRDCKGEVIILGGQRIHCSINLMICSSWYDTCSLSKALARQRWCDSGQQWLESVTPCR